MDRMGSRKWIGYNKLDKKDLMGWDEWNSMDRMGWIEWIEFNKLDKKIGW